MESFMGVGMISNGGAEGAARTVRAAYHLKWDYFHCQIYVPALQFYEYVVLIRTRL